MAWALWIRAWLGRIELRSLAAPFFEQLNLTPEAEGWRSEIRTATQINGEKVQIRWSLGISGLRAQVKLQKGWEILPLEGGLLGLQQLVAQHATKG